MRSVCLTSPGISDTECSQWTAQGQICRARIILRNYSVDIFNLSNNRGENIRGCLWTGPWTGRKKKKVDSSNKLFPMNYSRRAILTVIPTFLASLQGLTIMQFCQFLDFDFSRNKISECAFRSTRVSQEVNLILQVDFSHWPWHWYVISNHEPRRCSQEC